jgi:hypothetical protein
MGRGSNVEEVAAKCVTITLRDQDNQRISGCKVTLEGKTAMTSAKGVVRFAKISVIRSVVSLKKDGFVPLQKVIDIPGDGNVEMVMTRK